MIDAGTLDPEEFLDQADIVVFALYPHIMIDWIHEHQNAFRPGTLLTDVSGVKVNVADKVQSFLRDDVEFIAAHPMAGRELYRLLQFQQMHLLTIFRKQKMPV